MLVLIWIISYCIGMFSGLLIQKYVFIPFLLSIMIFIWYNVFFILCNVHNKIKSDSLILDFCAFKHYRNYFKGHNPKTLIVIICFITCDICSHTFPVYIRSNIASSLLQCLFHMDMVSQHHIWHVVL